MITTNSAVASGKSQKSGPYWVAGAILMLLVARAMNPQSAVIVAPRFEVAAIKPCGPDTPVPRTSRGGGGGGSSGLLRTNCQTVRDLVLTAYGAYANGHTNPPPLPTVEGGQKWVDSERYTIDAKTEGSPNGGMMQGPMLQALLEDRFQLKVRREFRDGPAYALTVANGGSKLRPHESGSCIEVGAEQAVAKAPPPRVPGERIVACGYIRPGTPRNGTTVVLDVPGVSLDRFARTFLGNAFPERPVINKTGLAGLFDIRLEFAPDETMQASAGARAAAGANTDAGLVTTADPLPAGPSIFTALQQQLGLKLESARGAREFIVIEHVERPSEN